MQKQHVYSTEEAMRCKDTEHIRWKRGTVDCSTAHRPRNLSGLRSTLDPFNAHELVNRPFARQEVIHYLDIEFCGYSLLALIVDKLIHKKLNCDGWLLLDNKTHR